MPWCCLLPGIQDLDTIFRKTEKILTWIFYFRATLNDQLLPFLSVYDMPYHLNKGILKGWIFNIIKIMYWGMGEDCTYIDMIATEQNVKQINHLAATTESNLATGIPCWFSAFLDKSGMKTCYWHIKHKRASVKTLLSDLELAGLQRATLLLTKEWNKSVVSSILNGLQFQN